MRGLLGTTQRATLFEFFDCLALICAESHDATSVAGLELRLNSAIALMERDFPMTLQVCAIYPVSQIIMSIIHSLFLSVADLGDHNAFVASYTSRNKNFWSCLWNLDVSI